MAKTKSVCIIGAGSGGLCALQNIQSSNSDPNVKIRLDPIVFEKSDTVGGVWDYRENDEENVGNPMYSGLRVNLPRESMRFMDFGPENYEGNATYVTQPQVLKYLNKYADEFNLRDFVQLNRMVTDVKKLDQKNGPPKWLITVQNTKDETETWEFEFDVVIVCNGHHHKCRYSENYEQIKNNFKGQIMHSRDYNRNDPFKGKNVVVVGGAASGLDISLESSKVAKNVYMSLKNPEIQAYKTLDTLHNFHQIHRIKMAKEHSVILANGEEIECDVIIFCTGYDYIFPFLNEGIPEIKEDGRLVYPLYLHMIHIKYPSIAFMGIPYLALPFLTLDCQIHFYIKYLRGDLMLPSESEMFENLKKDLANRKSQGLPNTHAHLFHTFQWPYFEKLGKEAGFYHKLEKFLPILIKAYQSILKGIFTTPMGYRDRTFEKILNDAEFIEPGFDAYNLNLKC